MEFRMKRFKLQSAKCHDPILHFAVYILHFELFPSILLIESYSSSYLTNSKPKIKTELLTSVWTMAL